MELSENEKQIVEIVRELKPFEIVEIHKDKLGRADFYIVKRTQKLSFEGESGSSVVVNR